MKKTCVGFMRKNTTTKLTTTAFVGYCLIGGAIILAAELLYSMNTTTKRESYDTAAAGP